MIKLTDIAIFAVIVVLAIVGWTVYHYYSQNTDISQQVSNNPLATSTENATDTTPVVTSTFYQDWETYSNAQYGFSLKYPKDIAVIKPGNGQLGYDWESFTNVLGIQIAQVYISKSFEPGTNFSEAWVNIGQSNNSQAVANCLNSYPNSTNGQATSSNREINNIVFSVSSGIDAGAGNFYKFTGYRVIRNNQCFAINLVVHYTNFQNYPAGTVQEFDYDRVYLLLDQILQTFAFTK